MRPVGSKYLLEEPLGRGATGTVWRGRQRETAGAEASVAGQPGEQVAIKVLKEELAHDPDVVMRFLRERSVLLRLADDNIVRTRDLVVEGDLLALVMDLVDGPDLHRYLHENGPFGPVGAALITAGIADALAAAHAKGVVHRDLKPANVLLAGDGRDEPLRPMLTDFGIARLADSPGVTRAHEFVGTPSYVAPESAEGRPQTSAVDIYGTGILLYELVTGRPPFRGGSALEVLQRHLSEQVRQPEGVPDPLWTVIEYCLRKRPEERPGAVSLARALRTVGAGLSDRADPEQRSAAVGVAALLIPDARPVRVAGSGLGPAGSADPTEALPGGPSGATDPNAATSVLPQAGTGRPDSTRAMPAHGQAAADEPHPWEDQMRAARDRNEQTMIQPMDAVQDPLYRAPQRPQQPAPQQQPRRPQRRSAAEQQGYGGPQPARRAYGQEDYGYPQQQQYERPQPGPRQPPPQQPPAPRQRREPRPRNPNPMRIPGLGCLKGCLFMLLVLVIVVVLVWNFTPLADWIAEGQGFWEAAKGWFETVREWAGSADAARYNVEPFQNS
ncbi:serine/threonine-protein kinase [Streptomyces sp. ACA25]|uniref:serine/threonine-protein kinase n=1 Tax=Streptomyces sp. ACA25 TaxID=3022596 RepID=UPI0023072F29|nr:serine/threonine-protein kinase [Streptomyces sp. ACA25]MDB1089472.1 serine/threonine-protein kinase [Streptomyces sp. ACA25]